MSKTAEKAERKRQLYAHNAMALERLLAHYSAGDHMDAEGLVVTAARIKGEIVGKYRTHGILQDKNGVSFDGPLGEDILAAMKAAFERGRLSK